MENIVRDSQGRCSEGVAELSINENQPLSHKRDLDNLDMRCVNGMYHHCDYHFELRPQVIGDYYSND